MKKFLYSFILAVFLFTSMGVNAVPAATISEVPATTISESPNEKVFEVVNVISKGVEVSSKGFKINNEKAVLKDLESVDLVALEEVCNSQGIVHKGGLTPKIVLKIFTDGMESVNMSLEKGDLKLLSGGTLVDPKDDKFYIQGGSTYDVTYWWGKSRYKSTANAATWVYELNSVANADAGIALLCGVAFGAVGAVPNGLTSAYCYQLANTVSYRNSLNSRGIIANLTWLLAWTTESQ